MDEVNEGGELSRRAFLKRMAVGAFAIPVVTSFALDAASASGTATAHLAGNQGPFDQYEQAFGNQSGLSDDKGISYPNQGWFPNQGAYPNQYVLPGSAHYLPNQYVGNQLNRTFSSWDTLQ